jgi:hypothetical protein
MYVGISSGIGLYVSPLSAGGKYHRKKSRAGMLDLEVLIGKLIAIDFNQHTIGQRDTHWTFLPSHHHA